MSTRSEAVTLPRTLAQNDDFAGGDGGCDLAVASHGGRGCRKVDAAFDLAVDKQRLGAGDLSLMNRPLPMVAWSPPAATGARMRFQRLERAEQAGGVR